MPKKIDLTGKRFNRLIVIKEDKNKVRYYYCRCDCGTIKSIKSQSIREGWTQSCGCLHKERSRLKAVDPEQRFWPKVHKTSSCWLWIGYKDKRGYGRFNSGKHAVNILAHKFSYELTHGKVPTGLELDHIKEICGNTSCVNPKHLEAVTHIENLRRGNSPPAINARKTHCKSGHEFTKSNTYITKKGNRKCILCVKEWRRNQWLKNKK